MLVITRKDGETWRQCAERYAAEWGLQEEVLSEYDACVSAGCEESDAAWRACCEWDVLDYRAYLSKEGAI